MEANLDWHCRIGKVTYKEGHSQYTHFTYPPDFKPYQVLTQSPETMKPSPTGSVWRMYV